MVDRRGAFLKSILVRYNEEDDAQDQLMWAHGAGRPERTRWKFATRTDEMPGLRSEYLIIERFISLESPYLMLASNPRDATDNALLLSDPIPCQLNDGTLMMKHWRSLSRTVGNEPRLSVCYRCAAEIYNVKEVKYARQ